MSASTPVSVAKTSAAVAEGATPNTARRGQYPVDVTTSRSELGDVMLTLVERFAGLDRAVPARAMTDNSLRFLAILVALLQLPTLETMPEALAFEDALGQTALVIEELYNGLHASRAQLLIGLAREEVNHRRVRALATTHSPALLDALSGDEHGSVIVCQRDPDGHSTLHRLVDLPNYVDIVAAGKLGRSAERDLCAARTGRRRPATEVTIEI